MKIASEKLVMFYLWEMEFKMENNASTTRVCTNAFELEKWGLDAIPIFQRPKLLLIVMKFPIVCVIMENMTKQLMAI